MISKLIKAEKPKILDVINYYWETECIHWKGIRKIIEKIRKQNRHRSYGHRSK